MQRMGTTVQKNTQNNQLVNSVVRKNEQNQTVLEKTQENQTVLKKTQENRTVIWKSQNKHRHPHSHHKFTIIAHKSPQLKDIRNITSMYSPLIVNAIAEEIARRNGGIIAYGSD